MNKEDTLALAETFHEQGYVVLKNVLSSERVERLNRAIDEIVANEPQKISHSLYNCVRRHSEIADLIDEPTVLPLVVNILGYNIQLHISHLTIRHPNFLDQSKLDSGSFINWHQDGPHPEFPAQNGITSLYYLKACYLLSDLSEPGRGNTKVVPGSHKRPFAPEHTHAAEAVENEIEITGVAGDVFLFGQNLWHAAAPNRSDVTRRLLFMGYSYIWMKPIDYHVVEQEILQNSPPIRKQLLGYVDEDPFRYYVPKDDQLPLKALYLQG